MSRRFDSAASSAVADPEAAGLRFGEKGTHTSRTIMLPELTELLGADPRGATREDYVSAVVLENVLGKRTASNRRHTSQRLGELYALDPAVPIFRVLLRLWDVDVSGRPLLALLCALGRDPLLRATAPAVLRVEPGQELLRTDLLQAIAAETDGRLNAAVADKVARNAGSSWSQSGHLDGRVRKLRRRVRATPGAAAFALWLGTVEGLAGEELLRSSWAEVLDVRPPELLELTLRAKQLGLVSARVGGGVVEIDARGLDPAAGRR